MREFERAEQKLAEVERLLARPDGEEIRKVEQLFTEIAGALDECSGAQSNVYAGVHARRAVEVFRRRCERVRKLLAGAQRAQWIRLRLIMSLTQTYTARAEAKNWTPREGTVNICM